MKLLTKRQFMSVLKWNITETVKHIGRHLYVFCICECGSESWVRKTSLNRNSFGCKKCRNAARTHGLTGTKLHNSWSGMKQRCEYSKHIGFKNYGGRGIRLHPEWRDFANFAEWALSNGYSEGLSIERIDHNGHYEPSNCSWISKKLQPKNSRTCIFFEKNGVRMILKDWCRKLNVNYGSVRDRISRGWSIEESLLEPGLGNFYKENDRETEAS